MRRRRGQILCCSFFMFACLAQVLKVVDFRIYFNCLKFSCDRSIEKCNILVIKIWLRINVFSSRVSLVQFTQMHFLRCRWFRGFLEYYLCILSAKLGVGVHIGPKSLILAPQEILDISGYQWGFGCQCVKAYNNDIPVTNQKIL